MSSKLITLSVVFMCLTLLNGCGKNEKRICESKGDNWYWDGSDNSCNEKTDEDAGQDTDQTEGANALDGVKSDYFILVLPIAADKQSLYKVSASISLDKSTGWYNPTGWFDKKESISITSSVDKEGCLKVSKSYISNLKVSVTPKSTVTGRVVVNRQNLCGGSDTDIEKKCELDVYELASEGSELQKRMTLKKRTAVLPTECQELKLEEE